MSTTGLILRLYIFKSSLADEPEVCDKQEVNKFYHIEKTSVSGKTSSRC